MTEVKKIAPSLIEMAKEVVARCEKLKTYPVEMYETREHVFQCAPALAAALLRAEELLKLCTGFDQDSMETAMARDEARAFLASLKEPQQ